METELSKELKGLMSDLTSKTFVIERYMVSKKKYIGFIEEMYDIIKKGYEHKEFRTMPISFKFHDEDQETNVLELRHFITNLIIWQAYMRIEVQECMNKSYIYDASNITSKTLYGYFNDKIIIPYRRQISNKKMNRLMHDIIHDLSRISTDFNIILGITMNMHSIIQTSKENERFNEIIHTKVDESMQPADVEHLLDTLMIEEIEILKKHPNCMQPILMSGTGIKDKQLREFSINSGFKPDLYGNTVAIPINSNFIVGGLKNIPNYFLDAIGGRKALIMAKLKMGISGHFAATVILLSSSVHFSKTVDDCNTLYPVPVHIKSKMILSKFVGRYYKEHKYDTEYKVIKIGDLHLIGKDIFVRSPITCAAKDGICPKCYGELYGINKDLESPGALSAIKLTMPVSQDVLSAKHLLTTVSVKLEFPEEFNRFFKLCSNYIVLNEDSDVNFSDWSLVIDDDSFQYWSEYDQEEYNNAVVEFKVRNNKTNEVISISEIGGNELYLDKDVFKSLKRSKKGERSKEIILDKIDSTSIFIIEIKNNELTKPLYDIMSLLDKSKNEHRGSIESMVIEMCNLMIQSRINLHSIHAEMILTSLIRKKDNILERPDFSTYGAEDYQILTIKGALENNASPIIGISFQYLKRQLTKRVMTYQKHSESILDPLFKEYK